MVWSPNRKSSIRSTVASYDTAEKSGDQDMRGGGDEALTIEVAYAMSSESISKRLLLSADMWVSHCARVDLTKRGMSKWNRAKEERTYRIRLSS